MINKTKTRILVIGDPHGEIEKIRKIPIKEINPDLILVTGDIGKADLARKRFFENQKRIAKGLPELKDDKKFSRDAGNQVNRSTIEIFSYLHRFSPVYSLQGNVGIPGMTDVKKEYKKHRIRIPNTRYQINKLEDVSLTKNRLRILKGIRIGFLEHYTDNSYIKEFKVKEKKRIRWAKKSTAKARRVLGRFNDLDILLSHQPPYGYLDKINFPGVPKEWIGKHAGSKVLLDYIRKSQKKNPPRYVFCGHIHEGEGEAKIGKTEIYNLGVAGHKVVEF